MKRIAGLLVFTALMLVKVSAFHVYSHHHDDYHTVEHCEICDIALECQSSDLEMPSPFVTETSEGIILNTPFKEKAQVFSGEHGVHQLFSRPPPFHT